MGSFTKLHPFLINDLLALAHKTMLVVVLVVAGALLRAATLANASATEIPMTFYTDNSCDDASSTAAAVSVNIDVCVVTPGLGSFVLDPFPCSSGSVIAYVFGDTACGNVAEDSIFRGGGGDGTNDNCYGPIKGDLAAIMLSCKQDTPGQPSSTTTIDVGPVATGASPTSISTSSTATSGSGGGGGSSPSSSSSSSSGTGSGSASSSSNPSGWDSLDLGTRIGIMVALAVGIPPILIGIYTIRLQKKKKERRRAEEEAMSHGTPMQTYPNPYTRGGGANGYFHSQTVLVGSSPPAHRW